MERLTARLFGKHRPVETIDYRHYSPLDSVGDNGPSEAQTTTPLLRSSKIYLAPSQRGGTGVFNRSHLQAGETVGLAVEKVLHTVPHLTTELGAWLNHSFTPNCSLRALEEGRWSINGGNGYELVTMEAIPAHMELTINYDLAPWSVRPLLRWRVGKRSFSRVRI